MDELREAIQESWTKAVLAAGSVEEHAQALVGSLSQRAALAPEHAKKMAAEVAERIAVHRRTLTGEVERAVRSAIEHVRMPARSELRLIAEKLTALEARLGELERGGGGKDR